MCGRGAAELVSFNGRQTDGCKQRIGDNHTVVRLGPLYLRRIALACCFGGAAISPIHAQDKPIVIAISGELTATRLSRAVAQRVGTLLQRGHPEFRVVRADTIAWLLDNVISYSGGTPSSPQDLREICRQFGASAIVDIMMFRERQAYRGIAFRTVILRRPSATLAAEFALLPVGDATASTADSVAQELIPQVIDALRRAPTDRPTATPTGLRCLDFSESGDTTARSLPAPSNRGCC